MSPLRHVSILDTKPSHILDFPLTLLQQIWFLFLLPTLFILTIYILNLATDIAVGLVLLAEDKILAGCLTLSFIYLAPLISFILRLMSPPDRKEVKIIIAWFILELTAFILFPIRPIQCLAERFFWSIEAIRNDDPKREEALIEFENTRALMIENYFFFQAFLQAGPQAILQIILLLLGVSQILNTQIVQIVCVLCSLATISMITTSYQRYEAQTRGGRRAVWKKPSDSPFEDLLLSHALDLQDSDNTPLPRRRVWIKVMDEDNPLGSLIAFIFWFLFLLGRLLCLIVATVFYPWVVLGVCIAHYLFSLLYILPSPDFKAIIPIKILLAFVYIFCLIEVGVQFRKSCLFYSLFFTFSVVENFILTIIWVLWADWYTQRWWYEYLLYVMGITHALALFFVGIYMKFFKPAIKRLQPT